MTQWGRRQRSPGEALISKRKSEVRGLPLQLRVQLREEKKEDWRGEGSDAGRWCSG